MMQPEKFRGPWCVRFLGGVLLAASSLQASAQEAVPRAEDEAPALEPVHLQANVPVAIDVAVPEPPPVEAAPAEDVPGEEGTDEATAEGEAPIVDAPPVEGSEHDYPADPGPREEAVPPLPPDPEPTPWPHGLGSLSLGTPDGGLLFNPDPFPEGHLWTVREPAESFATAETIAFITRAIEVVEARHPGAPRLVIGDISRPDGGRLDRHRSHQAGRDADIGFYFLDGDAATLRRPGARDLDLARTWTLVRALVTETDVERIFLDRKIQRVLYDHALREGEDRDWLDDLFGRRTAGKDAIIQHERRHQDHLHARFFNPEAQERGRVAYPVLVEAGLVPGPTLKHRVRSGETLSHLSKRYGVSAAKIRSANGLRGTTLRAGRTYAIPVRKMPELGTPVVVPPRRLPPTPAPSEAAFVGSAAPGLQQP